MLSSAENIMSVVNEMPVIEQLQAQRSSCRYVCVHACVSVNAVEYSNSLDYSSFVRSV